MSRRERVRRTRSGGDWARPPSAAGASADRQLATGGLRGLRLLRPGREDVVLVRPDRAVLVAVVELVAVAERHALRGEERAEERRRPRRSRGGSAGTAGGSPTGPSCTGAGPDMWISARRFVVMTRFVRVAFGKTNRASSPGMPGRRRSSPYRLERARRPAPRSARAGPDRASAIECGQHRRGALELHVALALLVERDAGAMADELVRQRPRDAADARR